MSATRTAAALLILIPAAFPVASAEGDVKGGVDHERLGRFEGAVMKGFEKRDFDEYVVFEAPAKRRDDRSGTRTVEGELRHIAYQGPEGASLAEVFRNYRNKLEAEGYSVTFQCKTKECGGGNLAYAVKVLPIPQMTVDPFNFRYLSATRTESGRNETVALMLSVDNRTRVRIHLTSVVAGELEDKMVNAAQMAKGLGDEGHIAIYGIYFDTDSATLKAESAPTLTEIAKLLSQTPKLNLIVVGHTDNQGGLDYNMDLSRRRASAVVQALTAAHGVARARLTSAGVGYLAPIASNVTDAGRALNRRVELIEDK
jgi:outer membrane protein OmpA-like peptidoglycan-associated protein